MVISCLALTAVPVSSDVTILLQSRHQAATTPSDVETNMQASDKPLLCASCRQQRPQDAMFAGSSHSARLAIQSASAE